MLGWSAVAQRGKVRVKILPPEWLTDSGLLDSYNGQSVNFSFSKPERSVFRRPAHEDCDIWVEKNFILTQGDYSGQLYSHKKTPHLKDLMWAFTQPCVREFYYAGASQGAMKSTLAYGVSAWLDVYSPQNALHCYPTEPLAIRNNTERLQKIYTSPESPKVLSSLRTGNRHDENKEYFRLTKSVHYFGYAGSDDTVKDLSAGFLHVDETDSAKYSGKLKKVSGGKSKTTVNYFVPQARKRVRTYSSYKALFCSSVSVHDGFIWIGVTKEASMAFWFWPKCPYCMTLQPMRWSKERFIVKKNPDGSEPTWQEISERKLGRYRCINESGCGKLWTDADRDQAAQLGEWRRFEGDPEDEENFREPGEHIRQCIKKYRPRKIAAIFPAWMCALGADSFSLSETISLYYKSKDKELPFLSRLAAEEDFEKDHRSFPFRMVVATRPLSEAQALIGENPLPHGIVPGGNRVCALIAGVDTQSDHFYLSVWAFGYGINPETWLVYRKMVYSKEELTNELSQEFYTADKQFVYSRWHGNLFGGIDYLGDRHKEIWEYACSLGGFLIPTHGSTRIMSKNYAAEQRETWPGTTTPLPSHMQIMSLRVNTIYYKDYIYRKSIQPVDSPGPIHFCDLPEKDDFLQQWVVETRGKDGFWYNTKNKPNHYWDTGCIAFCVADFRGLHTNPIPIQED